MEESWRRKCKVVRKWNVIVWKGILFLFFCLFFSPTMLTACVFVTRDSTSSEKLCVRKICSLNRIVHDPRLSWKEVWLYLLNYSLSASTACCNCIAWIIKSKVAVRMYITVLNFPIPNINLLAPELFFWF